MSKPAKLPPEGTKPWELAIHASTEVVIGSLSFMVALALALAVTWAELIPQDQAMLLGPLTLALTGLSYYGFERLLARTDATEITPLVREPESVGRSLLIVLGGIALAQAGAVAISLIQSEIIGIKASEQASILELVESGDPALLVQLGISAVILAPLSEELLFRYMFFRRLVHSAGPVLGFGLSALAFSLFHFNASGFVIYVWLGLVFAATYRVSGRPWVAISTHAGYNATAFALLVWGPGP